MTNHTHALRPVTSLPTYEQVVGCHSFRTGLTDALRAMRPGDVIDATDLTRANARRQAVRSAAAYALGPGHIRTRIINGRIYVARLRPEDVRLNGGGR